MESKPKFKKTLSRRKKEQPIVNDIYIFNLHIINKDKSKFYKCSGYKTIHKCKAFIKLNEKEEIINFLNDIIIQKMKLKLYMKKQEKK